MRPEISDIVDLAAKGRLLLGEYDSTLLVRKPISGHRSRVPFDDPIRIYVPHLARP